MWGIHYLHPIAPPSRCAVLGRVELERPNTGRHEKAPVRCPCSRLAALHGAHRTLLTVMYAEHVGLMKVICGQWLFGDNVEMQVWPLCVWSVSKR